MPTLSYEPQPTTLDAEDRFSVSLIYDNSLFMLEPFGELDLATANLLEGPIARALASPAETVLIDLSGLHFIDSTGIRILLQASQSARDKGVVLRFLRGSGQVQRMLAICAVEGRLRFLD